MPESRSFIRLVIGVGINLAVFTLTLTAKPYFRAEDNMLAVSAQLLLIVMFVGAGYVKAFEAAQVKGAELGSAALGTQIYGFASTNFVVVVLLMFAMSMIALLLAMLPYLVIAERQRQLHDARVARARRLRYRKDGMEVTPPTLADGKFHVFLSQCVVGVELATRSQL